MERRTLRFGLWFVCLVSSTYEHLRAWECSVCLLDGGHLLVFPHLYTVEGSFPRPGEVYILPPDFCWISDVKKQMLASRSAACESPKLTASYQSQMNILTRVNCANQNTGRNPHAFL